MSLLRAYLGNWSEVITRDHSRIGAKMISAVRSYPSWRESVERNGNALVDRIPWIPFEARRFIESALTPGGIVFEYGSGGSSHYYSKRVKSVISVEHDSDWFQLVKRSLAELEVENCKLVLIPPEPTDKLHHSPDDPESYRSRGEPFDAYSFCRYVKLIDSFPDQHFDLVAVDGRARPSCVAHARRKVKPGGYLMLDNSDRPHYQKARSLMSNWQMHEFYGPGPYNVYFWGATIWKKVNTPTKVGM